MVISGFHREIGENCAILGYNAASTAFPYRRFTKNYRFHLQGLRISLSE